jgi:hypothetical protein
LARGRSLACVVVADRGPACVCGGRPALSTLQLVELAFILAFVVWGLWQSLLRTPGYSVCLLIGVGAIWAAAC